MATFFEKHGLMKNIYRPTPMQPISKFSCPTRPNANIFERMNNSTANIGRWMAGSMYEIATYIGLGVVVLVWIAFIVGDILTWKEYGFLSSVIYSTTGGVVTYYITLYAGGLIIKLLMAFVWILRYIFHNLISLVITVVLLVGIVLFLCSPLSEEMFSKIQQSSLIESTHKGNDMAVYGLVGPVKSFSEKEYGQWTVIATFTSDGKLETLYGKNIEAVKKIKRDDNGYIISMTDLEANEMDGGNDCETYNWTDGKLVSSTYTSPEGQTTTSYNYNVKGTLIHTRTTGAEGDQMDIHEDYSHNVLDEHGNWTTRVRKHQEGSFTEEFKEERKITYWE